MTTGTPIGIPVRMSYLVHPMKFTRRIALFVLASVALLLAHAETPRALPSSPLQTVSRGSDQGFTVPSRLEATIRTRVLSEQSVKTDLAQPDPAVASTVANLKTAAVHTPLPPAKVRSTVALVRATNKPREPPLA